MWNQQRPELLEIRPLEMKTLEVPCECFILVMTAGADAKRRELRLMGCVCVCVWTAHRMMLVRQLRF